MKTPPLDFATFVLSLASSVQIHLGLVENPETKQKSKNLNAAQQTIDILAILQEKTKGNLNDQEAKLMEQIMYSLRLQFIEANK